MAASVLLLIAAHLVLLAVSHSPASKAGVGESSALPTSASLLNASPLVANAPCRSEKTIANVRSHRHVRAPHRETLQHACKHASTPKGERALAWSRLLVRWLLLVVLLLLIMRGLVRVRRMTLMLLLCLLLLLLLLLFSKLALLLFPGGHGVGFSLDVRGGEAQRRSRVRRGRRGR